MRQNLQFSAAMHNFKLVSWIVLIFCFSKSSEGFRIDQSSYSVVEELGNSCPASESCEHRRSVGSDPEATPNNYTCACDDECSEYDDCCIDGPRRPLEKNQMKCLEVEDQEGVYMIDSCPKEYNGSEIIRKLCDLIYINYQSDPLSAKPTTNFFTGITYKNTYCSSCKKKTGSFPDRKPKFIYEGFFGELWPLKWECSRQPEFNDSVKFYTLMYLTYLWPQYDDSYLNVTHRWFEGCDVVLDAEPSRLHNSVRRCRPNLVSDCPSSWKDEYVRSMCEFYTGARFDHQAEGRGYRNVHCAICNGVDVTRLSCLPLKRNDTFRHSQNNSSYAEIQELKAKIRQCMKKDPRNVYCRQ